MQLYYIRHAESSNNHLYAHTSSYLGRSEDPDLTNLGIQQAAHLAAFLPASGLGITHLYSSLMVRAIATALPAARALGLPLVGWVDLHEGGGIYNYDLSAVASGVDEHELPRLGMPGKTPRELRERFPELQINGLPEDVGWWNKPFEERPARLARARRVLNELLRRHGATRDRVAVVSHGNFFNYLMRALLNISLETSGFWFNMDNCGISCLDFGEIDLGERELQPDEVRIVYINRREFMPDGL